MKVLNPLTVADFRSGRISKNAVSPALVPANSVANSVNVDYSQVIGSAVVRNGRQTQATIVYPITTGQQNTTVVLTDEASFAGTTWQAQLFTPATGQSKTAAISVKLYRVGTATGNVTFSLQTVSGGNPTGTVVSGNTFTLDASTIGTSTSGAVFTFLLNPVTSLTASTQYAIVMKYLDGSIAGSQYIQWMRSASASVSGASIRTTTDSGSNWSGQSGEFYFIQYVEDTNSTYSRAPMGNFSFLVSNTAYNVVAFRNELLAAVVIYYYDTSQANWKVSNLQNLSYLSRCRFAVLNGYVYEANGSQAMKSSADFGQTWGTVNCITTDSVQPSLLVVSKNRLLASGYSAYPSRVYFSSVVVPSTPTSAITWSTNATTGDWIDINPDDGGVVTGFSLTSNQTLVFKNNAMYRLNTITKTVDSENIFNVGAVSQEAITTCLGITYFYSGNGIYQTDGTFPQQISRLGVQDFLDAITSPFGVNLPTEVYAWNDGFNVYFSIGNITITNSPNDSRTYPYVVLKFSPRDQSWQVFTYNVQLGQTSRFGTANSSIVLSQQYNGKISDSNSTVMSDDGLAIPYQMETQEIDMGNRARVKVISDQIAVFTKYGTNGSFQVKANDGNFTPCFLSLDERINVGVNNNFTGNYFTFEWMGEALNSRPVFQGFHLPSITDQGVIGSSN